MSSFKRFVGQANAKLHAAATGASFILRKARDARKSTAPAFAIASTQDVEELNRLLRKACIEGRIMDARRLIDGGASVHACDEAFERQPLHHAAMHGHQYVVTMLCARGADPESTDLSDQRAMHLAAERGWDEVVSVLARECHANVLARSTNGRTALHHGAYMGHENVMDVLLECMSDRGLIRTVDVEDEWGGPSRRKIDYRHLADNWGKTPLDLAIERGYANLVKLMEAPRGPAMADKPKANSKGKRRQHAKEQPAKVRRTPRVFPGFRSGSSGGGTSESRL